MDSDIAVVHFRPAGDGAAHAACRGQVEQGIQRQGFPVRSAEILQHFSQVCTDGLHAAVRQGDGEGERLPFAGYHAHQPEHGGKRRFALRTGGRHGAEPELRRNRPSRLSGGLFARCQVKAVRDACQRGGGSGDAFLVALRQLQCQCQAADILLHRQGYFQCIVSRHVQFLSGGKQIPRLRSECAVVFRVHRGGIPCHGNTFGGIVR